MAGVAVPDSTDETRRHKPGSAREVRLRFPWRLLHKAVCGTVRRFKRMRGWRRTSWGAIAIRCSCAERGRLATGGSLRAVCDRDRRGDRAGGVLCRLPAPMGMAVRRTIRR
jgi:hypothetical protein